jgi:hypothetical protein
MMSDTEKRQLVYSLVDRLAPVQLRAIEELLSVMVDPGSNEIIDDELLNDEEAAAIRRSEASFERGGKGVPMEEVLADFGLSATDFPLKTERHAGGKMIDEEEADLTEEGQRAIRTSREHFRENPEGGLSLEQVAAKCGFTMNQIR